ncbi:MAG: amino acid ABC transporter permease, partial [Lactobacillales bacterium]|nr:amino acid ABC transporter permease [Lactobacillales bacterium]
GSDYRYFERYIAVALVYWAVSIIIEQTGRLIEKKLSIEPPKTSLETQEVIAND